MPQQDDSDDSGDNQFRKDRFDAQKALLVQAYEKLQKTLTELTSTQDRLIDSGKFAMLGETMAGVAHEVKGPLNAIVSSQMAINISMDSINKKALQLGRELEDKEISEIENLLVSFAHEDVLSNTHRSHELRATFHRDLEKEGFDSDFCKSASRILCQLPLKDLNAIHPILRKKNALDILTYVRDVLRIKTSCWISENSAIKSQKLVESLRDYTYDHKGEISKVNLEESLETILTIYQAELIDMEIIRDFQPAQAIDADPDRISQVWSNLLSNAIQASDKKGKLKMKIFEQQEHVIFSIKDYAGGIPTEIRDRIFDPFFTTKPKGQGTGLGLSIIKKIVEDHHGQIRIEVEENIGTEVIVKFKLK